MESVGLKEDGRDRINLKNDIQYPSCDPDDGGNIRTLVSVIN